MKLSVIVPVYKAEKYLEQCVDSLLSQSVEAMEIILVNDGSPDNSLAIMERYEKAYPQKIKTISLENGGQGRARNYGLEIAQGEYVGFVDSDDYIEDDMYELLLKSAEENNADIVVCNFRRVYDDGSVQNCVSWNEAQPLMSAGSCCDKIFKRELIADVRYPQGLWYEDFEFSAKLIAKAEKMVYVNKVLYNYRCGQQSTMNNSNTLKNLDILAVMENLRSFMLQHGKQDGFEYLLINHVLIDAVNRVNQHDTSDKNSVIKKMRSYVKCCIPNLLSCPSFKAESRNRKIIMALNYCGFSSLSKLILNLKSR